ncbi:MAG: 2-amino-4-hydroxy-6-hydroxymethyldihydropteridine pyrophosphokinase, partial [Halobacteriovorax sp.]|nr:2-amino-4-hydroxy-6-hydroxymethyldihydropteridine pyrophosphokinase [Halobacteriovorax sp.]
MSLVIALGSNIGDKEKNLKEAISHLTKAFGKPISTSNIYCSEPYGEISQDDFLNMCI